MELIMIVGLVLLAVGGLFFTLTKTALKLDNLNIRVKVITLSASIAAILSVALIYSSVKIDSMGEGFLELERVYIPLIGQMTKIEAHVFEQQISLLQLVIAERDHHEEAMLEHEEEFAHFATQIKSEILVAEEIIQAGENFASDDADLAWMEETLEHLRKIDQQHDDFDRHGIDIFALIAAGRTEEADVLETAAEEEGLELAIEIETFMEAVETRTEELSHDMTQEEQTAIVALIVLTIVALIVATLLTLFMANAITKPITRLQAGMKALGEGNLTYTVEMDNTDEIGQIADSLNEATDHLRNTMPKQQATPQQQKNGIKKSVKLSARSTAQTLSSALTVVKYKFFKNLIGASPWHQFNIQFFLIRGTSLWA